MLSIVGLPVIDSADHSVEKKLSNSSYGPDFRIGKSREKRADSKLRILTSNVLYLGDRFPTFRVHLP